MREAMKDQSSRNRLAVALISQNDEDRLPVTLKNATSFAEKVVVYDAGSEDGSRQIARDWGVEVIEGEFQDDFSLARNACLEALEKDTSIDWVLWLNAGERLVSETVEGFSAFLSEEAKTDSCYYLVLNAPVRADSTSKEQKIDLRLMPLRKSLRFSGRIRETLIPSMETADVRGDVAPGRILCDQRLEDEAYLQYRARRNLYLARLEEEADQPYEYPLVKYGTLLEKAAALQELREFAAARQTYLRIIAETENDPQALEAYYGLLSTFDHVPNLVDHQLQYAVEALERFPLDLQLLTLMASYMQRLKKHDLAIRALHTAVNHGQVMLEVWHACNVKEVAVSCLCMLLQISGKPEAACAILEECVVIEESPPELLRKLLDLYIQLDRQPEALELTERIFRDPQERSLIEDALRGACHAVRKEWNAALGYLQSAYVAGCEDILCLRWLSVVLLSNGQLEEAKPVLEEWKSREPENLELKAYLEAIRHPEKFAQRLTKMQKQQATALAGERTEAPSTDEETPEEATFQAEDYQKAKFRIDAPDADGHPLAFPQPKVHRPSKTTEQD
jgi:tetratricopeptide (TPR) repeat protein